MFLGRWILDLGWMFWLIVMLFVLAILWFFMGGQEYQVIGIEPLLGGFDRPVKVEEWQIRPQQNLTQEPPSEQRDVDEEDNVPEPVEHNPRNIETKKPETQNMVDATPVLPPPFRPPVTVPNRKTGKAWQLRPTKPPKVDPRNRAEEICRQTLESIYGVPFMTHYPAWLRNPETGRDLELDCYNPDVGIAVEYNGPQHYKWPNHFPMTKQEFISQVRRDRYKVDMCDANGVYLITVPYNVRYDLIPDYIRYYLPEAVAARMATQH